MGRYWVTEKCFSPFFINQDILELENAMLMFELWHWKFSIFLPAANTHDGE